MKLKILLVGLIFNSSVLFAQDTPSYANFVIRTTNFVMQHWSEFKYYTAQQRQLDDETAVFEIKASFYSDSIKQYFNDHFLKVKGLIPKTSLIDSISVIRPESNFPYEEFNTTFKQSQPQVNFKEYVVKLYFSNIFKSMGKYYTRIGIIYPGPRGIAMLYIRFDSTLNIEEYVIHGILE
jgi:hypothetical protein